MPWARRRYRGNKVWIETDDHEEPVLDARGLARMRYKPEDDRTYTVRPQEIHPVGMPDGTPADPAAAAVAARPRPAASARTRRTKAPAKASAAATAPDEPAAEGDDVLALAGREIHVWTDGAASGNPGPAGAGYVLLFREHRKEASIWLGDTTNNVAELTAVLEALRSLKRHDVPVRVHSDSTYVIGVVTGAMRAKANRELVEEIREAVQAFANLRFVKVDAHAGVEWNERADELAREAVRARRSRVVSVRAT
jgi:ribonuclease HI